MNKITPSVKTVKKKDNDFLCSLQFEFEPLEIFKEDGNVKEIEDDQSINNKEICNSNVNQKLNKRKNSLNLIRLDFEYLNFLEKNNSFFDFKFLNSIKSHNKKKKKTLILNDFDEGGCYQPLLNTVDHRTNIPCF
ncbi:hypothetical protein HK099_007794 [Clydaea vesicula]|uniref:Uncharacterized protein n=1 Tax=Clydaea vesicula TaxID=447962 RepID=A0AAD5TWQ3_9FUNG|nr:hypothetical protein HK099_007794 [Clydaea vesicula]